MIYNIHTFFFPCMTNERSVKNKNQRLCLETTVKNSFLFMRTEDGKLSLIVNHVIIIIIF